MAYELEVPVRHRTFWLAFTDPEAMARAVPGLTVDAVQPVAAADSPEGVSGDVVAGRLKLRIGGAGAAGATITYRGVACIAAAEAQKGTLDVTVDVAQARGNGALAGYLRISLRPVGDDEERTAVSIAPELEFSGRMLDLKRDELAEAAGILAGRWIEALAAPYLDADSPADEAPADVEPVADAEPEPETAVATVTTIADEAPAKNAAADALFDDSLHDDPLEPVWRGEYEKNPWIPVIVALTLLLLVRRRRRRRHLRTR